MIDSTREADILIAANLHCRDYLRRQGSAERPLDGAVVALGHLLGASMTLVEKIGRRAAYEALQREADRLATEIIEGDR